MEKLYEVPGTLGFKRTVAPESVAVTAVSAASAAANADAIEPGVAVLPQLTAYTFPFTVAVTVPLSTASLFGAPPVSVAPDGVAEKEDCEKWVLS